MKKYYFLGGKHTKVGTVAFASGEIKLNHELISELEDKSIVPFDFVLRKAIEGRDQLIYSEDLSELSVLWQDYQANSLAWPMMSEKMKNIIQVNLKGNEELDWITCTVKANEECKTYYILRFNKMLDVLNIEKTLFINGTDNVLQPCFSLDKLKDYNVFTKPFSYNLWKITPAIYISEELKKEMQKALLTGITFEETRVE
ncbi:imm11 family protein [Compostibacter hankyongensis]|uniref:Immunity MXAN-0049 protein domain-containing protein n=1 Tax=Compostibacter hankyongensis TaxID=1007089 RepID=A0ABP8G319_9BACT